MNKKLSDSVSSLPKASPAALAGKYLRAFSDVAHRIDDFQSCYEALCQSVERDEYLAGVAVISDNMDASASAPDFESLDSSETIIPICGSEESPGFLKYRGRRDSEPFNAEDLHLMGAIAGFVSVLTAQAQNFKKKEESSRVFQYLINQLPLGVVCFDSQGGMFVENKLAKRLLGDAGVDVVRGALSKKVLKDEGTLRMHLEVEGKLIYTEGRRLDVDDELSVHAFVLHDMSGQREKHLLQLERSVFRAESRQLPLTVAILEDCTEAGGLYRMLRAGAASLQLEVEGVLALDAHTCACIFMDKDLSSVRYLLRKGLPRPLDRASASGALVCEWADLDEAAPAQSLIDSARNSMCSLAELLRPAVLVLDPYPAVFQSLEWIGGETASFERIENIEQAADRVRSGQFDGIFLDIDTFGERSLDWLQSAAERTRGGFRIFYVSHKQPSMVFRRYGLGINDVVFQKPFDIEKMRETLALQFDFA